MKFPTGPMLHVIDVNDCYFWLGFLHLRARILFVWLDNLTTFFLISTQDLSHLVDWLGLQRLRARMLFAWFDNLTIFSWSEIKIFRIGWQNITSDSSGLGSNVLGLECCMFDLTIFSRSQLKIFQIGSMNRFWFWTWT